MAKNDNTHVAVHTVQMYDKDKKTFKEVAPGEQFTPNSDDTEALLANGAIREITDEDRKAAKATTDAGGDRVDGPTGYADNTVTEAAKYPGGVSNPNQIENPDGAEAEVSGDTDGKLPSSRTTRR